LDSGWELALISHAAHHRVRRFDPPPTGEPSNLVRGSIPGISRKPSVTTRRLVMAWAVLLVD
jgi:hypothetical protein